MAKTEPTVHSLITLDLQQDTAGNRDENMSLTELLSCSRECRSGSLLMPEKLDEQADFSDDDARSVDDALDEDVPDYEGNDFEGESPQEIMRNIQQEIIDSDEDENNSSPSLPTRPAAPPQRPRAPPQRPEAPQRPNAPKRPPVQQKEAGVSQRIEVKRPENMERVVPLKEAFVKSRSDLSFSEFDPLTEKVADEQKEVAAKPARPSRPTGAPGVPAKPRPPRPNRKTDQDGDAKSSLSETEQANKDDLTKNENIEEVGFVIIFFSVTDKISSEECLRSIISLIGAFSSA